MTVTFAIKCFGLWNILSVLPEIGKPKQQLPTLQTLLTEYFGYVLFCAESFIDITSSRKFTVIFPKHADMSPQVCQKRSCPFQISLVILYDSN